MGDCASSSYKLEQYTAKDGWKQYHMYDRNGRFMGNYTYGQLYKYEDHYYGGGGAAGGFAGGGGGGGCGGGGGGCGGM